MTKRLGGVTKKSNKNGKIKGNKKMEMKKRDDSHRKERMRDNSYQMANLPTIFNIKKKSLIKKKKPEIKNENPKRKAVFKTKGEKEQGSRGYKNDFQRAILPTISSRRKEPCKNDCQKAKLTVLSPGEKNGYKNDCQNAILTAISQSKKDEIYQKVENTTQEKYVKRRKKRMKSTSYFKSKKLLNKHKKW
ncbi:uncharacterized protein LOC130656568 isoform X2 [Hydractinia symbiolongicarpus]|nr:uncharacterized protein LOC130656568 isoform X2 [Hydractinia symbiolongicarpus]XP_057315441.1 uncharacterized protein LOC130656568 isoform X2 [Hydractinia symbiolongicarpus]